MVIQQPTFTFQMFWAATSISFLKRLWAKPRWRAVGAITISRSALSSPALLKAVMSSSIDFFVPFYSNKNHFVNTYALPVTTNENPTSHTIKIKEIMRVRDGIAVWGRILIFKTFQLLVMRYVVHRREMGFDSNTHHSVCDQIYRNQQYPLESICFYGSSFGMQYVESCITE